MFQSGEKGFKMISNSFDRLIMQHSTGMWVSVDDTVRLLIQQPLIWAFNANLV